MYKKRSEELTGICSCSSCVYSIMRPIPVMESGIKIGVGVSNTSVLHRLTACDVKRHKRDYPSDRFIQNVYNSTTIDNHDANLHCSKNNIHFSRPSRKQNNEHEVVITSRISHLDLLPKAPTSHPQAQAANPSPSHSHTHSTAQPSPSCHVSRHTSCSAEPRTWSPSAVPRAPQGL